ncbi:MAG: SagB/ThcOx family dehydrogenase [Thermoleophilia bacterium]|nr:SagB/ThcOx family dehydrogenase [Thermoleophilia bacterium]
MVDHPGPDFQKKTSYVRDTLPEREPDWRTRPATYKFYSHAPVISLPSPLPQPDEEEQLDLWTCVARRRSVRAYGATPLTLVELSRLLWASTGITSSYTTPHGQEFFRAAPAAGALYPIETYLVVNKVEDLEPGLYHYRVAGKDILERPIVEGSHSLEQLRTGDLRAEIAAAALDQTMCARAGVVFVWTAVFARSVWKYGDRAYRYIYLDAGHIAAHVSLAAVALGLGSCPVAAFYDDEVNALLGVDGETEGAVYMTTVGRPVRPFRAETNARLTQRPKE